LNSWIRGQKSFGEAMAETWNNTVMLVIQYFEQMAAVWISEHLIMAAVKKAFGVGEKVSNVESGISNAALAATAAFASVMAALPFPANVAAAPAVASATLAQGIAFATVGSFARGGVLDQDMVMFGHKREMMLPADLSIGLQSLIRSGRTTQGGPAGRALNLTYAPTMIGDRHYSKKLARQQSDEFIRITKQAVRFGKLRPAHI
jgi:hypothetical protein